MNSCQGKEYSAQNRFGIVIVDILLVLVNGKMPPVPQAESLSDESHIDY